MPDHQHNSHSQSTDITCLVAGMRDRSAQQAVSDTMREDPRLIPIVTSNVVSSFVCQAVRACIKRRDPELLLNSRPICIADPMCGSGMDIYNLALALCVRSRPHSRGSVLANDRAPASAQGTRRLLATLGLEEGAVQCRQGDGRESILGRGPQDWHSREVQVMWLDLPWATEDPDATPACSQGTVIPCWMTAQEQEELVVQSMESRPSLRFILCKARNTDVPNLLQAVHAAGHTTQLIHVPPALHPGRAVYVLISRGPG